MNSKKIMSLFLAALMLLGTVLAGITVAASASELSYSDVTSDMWSYDDIKYVTENGLMNGTGGTSFSPTVGVTRAMVVTVLYRADKSPLTDFKDVFTDIEEGEYYSDAVIWAYDKKIANGTDVGEWGETKFSPDRVITRQELATMFVRYAEYKGVILDKSNTLDKFTDNASVADWASDAMKWATGCGLINGTGNGDTLSPTMTATREQSAAIIHRFKTISFDYSIKYSTPIVQSTYTELPYPLVTDADIYVAVDGNDSNPGTFEKPVATFAKAVELISKVEKKGERKVAFMAGDYGITNVTMDESNSGTAESPITYCAYGDGEVYFTNGLHLTTDMFSPLDESDGLYRFNSEAADKIMKIDLTKLPNGDNVTAESQLFTNGMFCNRARVPNKSGIMGSYHPGFSTFVANDDSEYTYEELRTMVNSGEMSSGEMVAEEGR